MKSARWTSETAVCIASILLAARAYHYSPRRTSCNSAVFGFHLLPARCLTYVPSQLSPHDSNKRITRGSQEDANTRSKNVSHRNQPDDHLSAWKSTPCREVLSSVCSHQSSRVELFFSPFRAPRVFVDEIRVGGSDLPSYCTHNSQGRTSIGLHCDQNTAQCPDRVIVLLCLAGM